MEKEVTPTNPVITAEDAIDDARTLFEGGTVKVMDGCLWLHVPFGYDNFMKRVRPAILAALAGRTLMHGSADNLDAMKRVDMLHKSGYLADQYYETIRTALQQTGWRDIADAPRDGTKILTYNGNGGGYNGSAGEGEEKGDIAVACFDDDRWRLPHCCDGVSYNKPTHWQPLPPPPQKAE